MVKGVDLGNVVKGQKLNGEQINQLRRAYDQATHDAHNEGFRADVVKAYAPRAPTRACAPRNRRTATPPSRKFRPRAGDFAGAGPRAGRIRRTRDRCAGVP